jgi:hypothetical protein
VVCEVDNLLNRKLVVLVSDESVEGGLAQFRNDSNLYLPSEMFVVRLIDVKFKNLNSLKKYLQN